MEVTVVVVQAAFVAVYDEDREVESILIRRGVFLLHSHLAGEACLLGGAALLVQAATPALPEAAAARAVQAAQGEAAAAEGNPGTAVADAQSTAGEDGGAAYSPVAPLTVLPVAPIAASRVAGAAGEPHQVHQDCFRVAGHQLLVGSYVPLQLGAVHCVDTGHPPAEGALLGRCHCHVVEPKEFFHVVMDIGSAVLI